MNPQIAEVIGPLIALFGIGTFALIGLRMYLAHKARQIATRDADAGATERAEQLVTEMRDELRQLQAEVGDLAERVDFTERLLTRARDPEA